MVSRLVYPLDFLTCGMLGAVVHVRVMGQPFVLLNSSSAADDLPTKRSENYYGRHCEILPCLDLYGLEES